MMHRDLYDKCKTVEELKEDYNKFIDDYGLLCNDFANVCEENAKLKSEIEALKSELKQSVKLPCKVGDTIYLLDFEENKYDEATVEEFVITIDGKIEINSDYEVGTWSEDEYVKYSKESAEQALKGKV